MNDGTIHIALAFCDPRGTYARHATVTMDGARGTLFRLLIPDVATVDRIVYLDCDIVVTVVTMDIAELWALPLGARGMKTRPISLFLWGRAMEGVSAAGSRPFLVLFP